MVLLLAAGVATHGASAQTPSPQTGDQMPSAHFDLRKQAQSLATSGKLSEALAVYDKLTASGAADASLYDEARAVAMRAGDIRRVAVYAERQLKVDPHNGRLRELVAVAYQVANDDKNAQRAREEYLAYWKASTDPKVRSQPLFMIDSFKAGAFTVNVLQCTEIGGDFGVGYMFDIWGPKAPPLAPSEAAANHRGRIVLEHNQMTRRVMSELSKKEVPVMPTLDALYNDAHVTVQRFADEPPYAMLRRIVAKYVANDQRLNTSPSFSGARLAQIYCLPANAPSQIDRLLQRPAAGGKNNR